ncbi:calcium-binding protein [Rhizobium sp. Leaf384]|uniref:calcium-binding protein n=1 Tax=unclassified Rhizobium TaxID=2613769 RepID=UPI000714FA09|nr:MULTISPECIES: calcium-binding protein [unclassified Rhizobium]KQS77400.1 calcium-binding protein [Rhizobium sp. Leaf383]KQS80692.1 calcium-binding protein [Rhizobium sp. Leaf384]
MAVWTYSFPKNLYPLNGDYNLSIAEYIGEGGLRYNSSTTKQAIYDLDNGLQVKVLGSGFAFDSQKDPVSGTVTSIQLLTKTGTVFQTISGLNLSYADLSDAAQAYDAWSFQDWLMQGNDTITGSAGGDDMYGFSGNDIMKGGAGDDYMEGGRGKDTYDGGDGWDTISFQDSYYTRDSVRGIVLDATAGTVTDQYGNKETFKNIEEFRGTLFADVMTGSSRDETFMGLGGKDTIDGKGGFDMVTYHRDMRRGGESGVTVDLAKGTATDGFGKTDKLISIEGARGTELADKLFGSAVDNFLRGDEGNDLLAGRGGNDTLRGGAGKDSFLFDVAPNGSTNHDSIADFVVADDTIQLENAVFKVFAKTGVLAAGEFVINTTGKAVDANDHIIYQSSTGNLYYDADGVNGAAAVLFATVSTNLRMTADDFLIV